MLPVAMQRLYVNIAARMTRLMGQSARATPSKPPVKQSTAGNLKYVIASTMAMTSAMGQALNAGSFKQLNAIISHKIGANARRKIIIFITDPSIHLSWFSLQ
jgi:hypothetical protein